MIARTHLAFRSLFVLCALFALVSGCRHTSSSVGPAEPAGVVLYAKTGMHAAADKKGVWQVKSSNYIHAAKLIPAGASLTVQETTNDDMTLTEADGTKVQVRFEPKHSMMPFADWRARQFSSEPVQLPADLTELERKCIRDGTTETGISRQALFLAIGYPPSSLAPDLKARSLVYPTGTWGKKRFIFDDSDQLTKIED